VVTDSPSGVGLACNAPQPRTTVTVKTTFSTTDRSLPRPLRFAPGVGWDGVRSTEKRQNGRVGLDDYW
jgi:hypothetical protein